MDFLKTFFEAIQDYVSDAVSKAKYDRTVRGRITQALGNNTYKVSIDKKEYTCKGTCKLEVGDLAYVTIIQNNYNNLLATKPSGD